MLIALLLAVGCEAALPWSFSWDVIPTFGFPGAIGRFMTPNEVEHFANFSMNLIWGINATCIDNTGKTTPADCRDNHCTCPAAKPELQQFLPTQAEAEHIQGKALKDFTKTLKRGSGAVLGYIEGTNAQKYFHWENQLNNNESYADLRLKIKSKGVIDCFTDDCDYQGMSYRQYDHRQAAARDFFVHKVIGTLVASPHLDGTFLDDVDLWVTTMCFRWKCTTEESQQLFNASLAMVDEALQYLESVGKVAVVSSHTTQNRFPAYYSRFIQIVMKYKNTAVRFYEFFGGGGGMSGKDEFLTMVQEAQAGLSIQVHTAHHTMVPDWFELAQFLIAATDYCYFSYSHGWMIDSFPWQPEFSKPLGKPLGNATQKNITNNKPAWAQWPKLNGIVDMIARPKQNTTHIHYLGVFKNATACLDLAQQGKYSVGTHIGREGREWANQCYGRLGGVPEHCFTNPDKKAPCFTTVQSDCTSAYDKPVKITETLWERHFEHLSVSLNVDSPMAKLFWK